MTRPVIVLVTLLVFIHCVHARIEVGLKGEKSPDKKGVDDRDGEAISLNGVAKISFDEASIPSISQLSDGSGSVVKNMAHILPAIRLSDKPRHRAPSSSYFLQRITEPRIGEQPCYQCGYPCNQYCCYAGQYCCISGGYCYCCV